MSCMVINTHSGRTYRPKEGEYLILFLKDVNLVKPDKWGTSSLVTFLQQLLTYKGFYDENLEWVGLEGVQVVASMNPSSTMGRSELSSRFSSLVHILYIDYPDRTQLQEIYSAMLHPVLTHKTAGKQEWTSAKSISRLATTLVTVYEQLRSKFSVDDQKHYRFSPKSISKWVVGLLRYNMNQVCVWRIGKKIISFALAMKIEQRQQIGDMWGEGEGGGSICAWLSIHYDFVCSFLLHSLNLCYFHLHHHLLLFSLSLSLSLSFSFCLSAIF